MALTADRYTRQRILSIRSWTPHLFTFRITRDAGFRFVPGQFARLGVEKEDGTLAWRAYSIVSAPYDEYLEFFSIVVPGGEFTPRLAQLREGDEILLEKSSYGFLTTDRFESGKDLWLLATGTGLAPFMSILHDPQTWLDYDNIVLAHSVRCAAELAYRDEIAHLHAHPLIEEPGHKLIYVPIVTREKVPDTLDQRITALIASGALEAAAGLSLDRRRARIMICGNPQMVADTRELLGGMGYHLSRRAAPAELAVENAW